MSRIVLLAPGDVISECRDVLNSRGVSIDLRDWQISDKDSEIKDTEKQSSSEGSKRTESKVETGDASSNCSQDDKPHDAGSRVRAQGLEHERLLRCDSDGKDTRIHGARNDKPKSGDNNRDTNTRAGRNEQSKTHSHMSVLLDKREEEAQNIQEGGTENRGQRGAGESSQEKVIQRLNYYVLSDEIEEELDKRFDGEIKSSVGVLNFIKPSCFLEVGAQLLKRLGIGEEVKNEQMDELKRVKRILKLHGGAMKKKGQNFADVQFLRVDSEKGLREIFGKEKQKADSKSILKTRVTLITNKKEMVNKAHALFSAPTGDTQWKEVARLATKRPNIRAYVYSPADGVSLVEALSTLLDVI
nr:VP6 [Guangxi orbivirus]